MKRRVFCAASSTRLQPETQQSRKSKPSQPPSKPQTRAPQTTLYAPSAIAASKHASPSLDKEARLRSGARGLQARKALVAFEKVVAESEALLGGSCEDMTEEEVRAEMDEAADLLSQLQLQVEPSRMEKMQG